MTECPCCFKLAVDATGRCTRCGVQLPTTRPMLDHVHKTPHPRRRATQEPWETDYTRTKEDKA